MIKYNPKICKCLNELYYIFREENNIQIYIKLKLNIIFKD